jgi:integrase
MTVFVNKKRNKWTYDFRIDGVRYSNYCIHPETGEEAKNKREAKKIRDMIKANIQKTIDRGEKVKKEEERPVLKASITLAEVFDFYLEKMEGKASEPNVKSYIREMLDFFGGSTQIEKVEDRIYDYIEFSKKQKVRVYVGKDENGENKYIERDKLRSPKSINEYLKCLRKAYRDFKKAPRNKPIKHLIPNPPEFDLLDEYKRVPTPVPYNVTKTYLESFDEKLHAHTRLAYILCVQTGMRARECAQIRERQYSETEGIITLEGCQTKTRAGRFVYVNNVARKALLECRKTGDYLWLLLQEYPHMAEEYQKKYGIYSRRDINFILYRPKGTGVPRPVKHVATSAWKSVKKEVGINYRWHDTRAAFCTDTLGSSGNIRAVQQLAGHQDISTTQKYLHAADEQLPQAVNKLAHARPLDIGKGKFIEISKKTRDGIEIAV